MFSLIFSLIFFFKPTHHLYHCYSELPFLTIWLYPYPLVLWQRPQSLFLFSVEDSSSLSFWWGDLARMPIAQIIDQEAGSVYLYYRDFWDVGFLIFQPAVWGRGLPHWYSRNPVWVESPCPLRGRMGTMRVGISRLLFSGCFPWRFAMPLLRVRAAAAEIQPLSQNRGTAGRSPLVFWPL